MSNIVVADIDQTALKHNLSLIRKLAPSSKILAIIKANAYGHRFPHVIHALNSANAFGVARVDEALALKKLGVEKPIVVLEGFNTVDELRIASQNHFQLAVHSHWQLNRLNQEKLEKQITVWLKINTGMNRLGFMGSEVDSVWRALNQTKNVEKIVLMTHFANADIPKSELTDNQIETFQKMTRTLNAERSLANSAALLAYSNTQADWVRPGIMLYGISPFAGESGSDRDLLPVMTLKAQLIAIQQCQKGDGIGYGHTYVCEEAMPIGIVSIGYGDGYPRHAKNGTPVLINNTHVPLVGRVSMDMLTVDLRKCQDAAVGDEVILWGKGLPIEVVARHADTIAYELVCGITERVGFIVT